MYNFRIKELMSKKHHRQDLSLTELNIHLVGRMILKKEN
jgi:hypothetical protein